MRRAKPVSTQGLRMMGRWMLIAAASAGVMMAGVDRGSAQEGGTLKLGIVSFLSGPAAGPFGIPARNAAELLIVAINSGAIPAPYDTAGLAGMRIDPVFIDEAGGTSRQVAEFRNLVQRQNVDAVVGYISSGSCLAIAPVAEELRMLTVFFDCGTPRVFEERLYRYVFRTAAHATMDSVGAARYLMARFPEVETYAGINQNYAWGQDSWRDFNLAMQALKPGSKVTARQFPKLFAGQYASEISVLLVSQPQVVHSSLWGGDLESFVYQASARGLHTRTLLVLTTVESSMFRLGAQLPDGVIVGGRGPYGVFARPTPLNNWFRRAYRDRFGTPPVYPSYQMAQALLGLKIAYDKAATAKDKGPPTREEAIDAFEYLEYEAFGTTVKLALGKGHQAITETAYGRFQFDEATGEATIVDIIRFPAACVNPPQGVHSVDWIQGGMKDAPCE